MSQSPSEDWQQLARAWQTDGPQVSGSDIERLQLRQSRRLRTARAAELGVTVLGVAAALWLALASRFLWVGVLTAAFSVVSAWIMLRSRRQPAPSGSTGLLNSLQDALAYQDWLAEQLRYGRVLGFIALFAVVMVASTQLMHYASATRSGLLATAASAVAISAPLTWNMAMAWRAWRRTARLQAFRKKLLVDQAELTDG